MTPDEIRRLYDRERPATAGVRVRINSTKSASHAWRTARKLATQLQQMLWPCCIRPDAVETMRGVFIVLERKDGLRYYHVYAMKEDIGWPESMALRAPEVPHDA